MRKPADVAFGLDERPPHAVLVTAILQQTALIVVFVYPAIVLARAVGATPAEAASILSLTFVACAAGTLLQAAGRFGSGSGYLAPNTATVAFLAPTLMAAEAGGLPLAAGMTAVAGVGMVLLARLLPHLRALLPPEIVGTVTMILGVALALTGVRILLPAPGGGVPDGGGELAVAAVTLAVAGGLSVWGRGMLRWCCLLFALGAGSLVALALGEVDPRAAIDLASVPLVGLPLPAHAGFAFDATLLPPFLVAALAFSARTVGLVTTLQKLNDADWVRPEPLSIAGGVAGDGIAVLASGLLGVPAAGTSAPNVGVQAATGVTSRVIAFGTAGCCLVLACFPRAAAMLSQVPAPVIAAILLHAGGLMLVSGMQLTTSRMLDARRSLAVGLALVAMIGAETMPHLAEWLPVALRPVMSPVALGTLVAIGLNALLRIGIRKQVTLVMPAGDASHAELADVVTRAGGAWGARPDVIARTAELAVWCVDAITGHGLATGDVTITLGFDEFRLDLVLSYRGAPLDLADTPPSAEELLSDDGGAARLAGFMVRRWANRASVRQNDGVVQLSIIIDH